MRGSLGVAQTSDGCLELLELPLERYNVLPRRTQAGAGGGGVVGRGGTVGAPAPARPPRGCEAPELPLEDLRAAGVQVIVITRERAARGRGALGFEV